MNDDEDINKLIGCVVSFDDGREYKIFAHVRIDSDYFLACSTSPPEGITILELSMDDNGQMMGRKYEGKDYDDILNDLMKKLIDAGLKGHNDGLTESDKTEETPADTQERAVAQSITSVQRATSVKKTTSMDNEYVKQGMAFWQKKEYKPALESFQAARDLKLKTAKNSEEAIRTIFEDFRAQMAIMLEESRERRASQSAADEAGRIAETTGITDVDQAITEYTEALKSNPNDVSAKDALAYAYYTRGLTCASKGDHAGAVTDYNIAIKHKPDYAPAFDRRGQAHLKNGDFDRAVADFEELLRLDPNYDEAGNRLANAYQERGRAYDRKGDYARAISDFETVLKFKPDDSYTLGLLKTARLGNGDFDKPVADLEKLLRLDPNCDKAEYSLANAYLERGIAFDNKRDYGSAISDYNKAIEGLEELLRLNPNYDEAKNRLADAYNERGLSYFRKGNITRSISDHKTALQFKPGDSYTLEQLETAKLWNGDFDEIIAELEELRLNPKYDWAADCLSGAYTERGQSFDKKGDYARAIQDYETALKLNPDDNIGNDMAREYLQKAKEKMAKQ